LKITSIIKYSFPQQDIVMFLCFNQASGNRLHKHRQSWNYYKEKQKLTLSPSCVSKQSYGSSAILSRSPPSLPKSNYGLTNPRDIPKPSYRSSTNLPSSRCNPAKLNYGIRNLYSNALFTKSPTNPPLPPFSLYSVPKRS
jgi:hypothetical protein